MKKRILSLLLVLALCVGYVPISVSAAGTPAGTPISTPAQLLAVANDMTGKYYLANDIDLTGYDWLPLGYTYNSSTNSFDKVAFTGTFDGNGYAIKGLSSRYPLFYEITGTVKNLTIDETCKIEMKSERPFWNSTGTITATNKGTILNCVNNATVKGPGIVYVGGICAINEGTIQSCTNNGAVTSSWSTNTNGNGAVGGICGRNKGIVSECVNTADVTGAGTEPHIGGICGECIHADTDCKISQCWNRGTISSEESSSNPHCGGITGYLSGSTEINDCYNIGTVSAVSKNYDAIAGGIAGECKATISCAYNIGIVSASADPNKTEFCGEIAGYLNSSSSYKTLSCFYLDKTGSSAGGGTACTKNQLMKQETFTGFDFKDIWGINTEGSYYYPVLRALQCVHTYDKNTPSATVVSQANCNSGTVYYTKCDNCDFISYQHTVTVGGPEHSFTTKVSSELASAATCTSAATYYVQCDNCDAVNRDKTVSQGEPQHSFNAKLSEQQATAASCTANATYYIQCDHCTEVSDTLTGEKPDSMLSHSFVTKLSNTIAREATCSANAAYYVQCDKCPAVSDSKTVEKQGTQVAHKFTTYTSNNDASCTHDGTKTAYCIYECGTKDTQTDTGSQLNHKYTNYISNGDATYDADGTKTAKCDYNCGTTDTQPDVGSKLTPAPEAPFPFTDVPESEYFYQPVKWAVAKEITNGYSETLCAPNLECTRAQVVTFLWRSRGCPEPASSSMPFTDVPADAYYYKAVQWAVEQGVTKGTSATEFSPDDIVTRAQFVTFLWRNDGCAAGTGVNPFGDVPAGEYYTDAVIWAADNGITTGTSATEFSPDDCCTRGQVVTFLYRYFN